MRKINRFTAVLVLLLLAALAVHGATKYGIMPEDFFAFQFISDPHISRDGNNVSYVLTAIDQKKNHRVWIEQASSNSHWRRSSLTLGFYSIIQLSEIGIMVRTISFLLRFVARLRKLCSLTDYHDPAR
jgi:hypothetical protein